MSEKYFNRVLLAENDEDDVFLIKKIIGEIVEVIDVVPTVKGIRENIKAHDYDLLLLDVNLDDGFVLTHLDEIYKLKPHLNERTLLLSGVSVYEAPDVKQQNIPAFLNKSNIGLLVDLLFIKKQLMDLKGALDVNEK